MSLWTSYKALPPKTRMLIGVGMIVNAALALQFSDQIEGALGMTPTKREEDSLRQSLPRISLVDRDRDRDAGPVK